MSAVAPTEQLDLSELIDFELEALCGVLPNPHEKSRVYHLPACSGEATHFGRLACKQSTGLMCQAIASWMLRQMRGGGTCRKCKNPAAQCWRVVPV